MGVGHNNVNIFKTMYLKKILVFSCVLYLLTSLQIATFAASSKVLQTTPLSLKGMIVNGKGNGMPYAVVALVNVNNKIVSQCCCNEVGEFILPNVEIGKYTLEISLTGCIPQKYKIEIDGTKTDIGSFTLEEGVELKAITVSAKRPIIKTQIDRLVYNVELDPDAAKSSIIQILDKVPFVEVDKISGKIKVMGNEGGFIITVNGRQNLMLSESNQYVAKILEASRLKKIELITSPDGKNSNLTAVINIITKSSLPDGIFTHISANGSNETNIGLGMNLTSKIGRLIYNLRYNYKYSDLYGSKTITDIIDLKNNSFKYIESYYANSPEASYSHYADFNASYNISDLDLLNVNFNSGRGDNHNNITSHNKYMNSDNVVTMEFNGRSNIHTNNESYVGGVNYQRSFKDNPSRLFTVAYNFDTRENRMKYYKVIESLTGYTDNNDQTRNNLDNIENTVAIDFYNTISDRRSYYLTAKYINRNYGSNSWQTDMDLTPSSTTQLNSLGYIQQIGSLLGNYSVKSKKIMLMVEMGYEYTKDDIDYRLTNTSLKKFDRGLLANIHLTYHPTDKSTFTLTFQKSFFRPDIIYLNPYEDMSNPGVIIKGNPNLSDQKEYFSMLMYRFFFNKKFSLRSITSIRYSNNAVQQYSYMGNGGIMITTYGNISKNRMILFNLGATCNLASWFNIDVMSRFTYNKYEYSGNTNSYWDPYYGLSLISELWKGGSLRWNMTYSSPNGVNNNIQSKKSHLLFEGKFSFSQQIGKNIFGSISVSDYWKTHKTQIVEEHSSDYYKYQNNTILGRTILFTIDYDFGRFKDRVKTVQRPIQNTDRSK